jgi:O-antigen/teichoic acid export membrane protein
MKDQKKLGISISYINLILSTIVSLFLTPFIINSLGDDDYSIYKVMQSFVGPLAVFNLGVSTIVTRAIVKYRTNEDKNIKEKQNTLAVAMIASIIMAVVVAIVGCVMCMSIPSIYGKNYSIQLIHVGQIIFGIFVFSKIIHILTDVFNGCAIGHERFAFNQSMLLVKNVLRVPLIFGVLKIGMGVVAVTIIDAMVAIIVFLLTSGYSFIILKEYPKLTYISRRELLEMLSFSAAILLQAIVNQVNNNVDTMILGALVTDKAIVTMYSSALIIYGMYNSVVSVMATFFLPKATRLVTKNASGEELTDFVIKPGRYQAMIAVAIVVGFAVLGKSFIINWIGLRYVQAYYIVLILIVPVTIPLVENTAISILDASLKRLFRSLVLVIMAVINVIISIVLIKFIDYWGAALGTFISLMIGHVILMNWYYSHCFDMKIKRMFKEIFSGILPMGLIAGIINIPLIKLGEKSLVILAIKGIIFITIYCILIWKWGLKIEEKKYISQTLKIKYQGEE